MKNIRNIRKVLEGKQLEWALYMLVEGYIPEPIADVSREEHDDIYHYILGELNTGNRLIVAGELDNIGIQ